MLPSLMKMIMGEVAARVRVVGGGEFGGVGLYWVWFGVGWVWG